MPRKSLAILLLIILAGSLELTSLPNRPSEVLAVLTVGGIAVYLVWRGGRLIVPKIVGVPILIIGSIYTGHLITSAVNQSVLSYSLIRVPLFICLIVAFLFLIPQSTATRDFLWMLPRLGAVLVTIGLVPIAIGGFSIGPIVIEPYHATVPVFPLLNQPRIHAMKSVFTNPNMVSFTCSLGLVAALHEVDNTRTIKSSVLLALNVIGLQLSGSRAALLGALLAAGIYVGYRGIGPAAATGVFFTGIAGILTLIGTKFGVLPPLPVLTDISLNNREALWGGAFRAVSDSLIFGIGLVPSGPAIEPYVQIDAGTHGAFVYQLLSSGIVGLLAYATLYLYPIVGGIRSASDSKSVAIHAIAVAPLVTQTFQTFSLFGATMLPALTALSLGYSIKEFTATGCLKSEALTKRTYLHTSG